MSDNILATNYVGDFLKITQKDFMTFLAGDLDEDSYLYGVLEAKFFLADENNLDTAIDILALKYRTKKRFLFDFISLHMIVPTIYCNSNCRYCQVLSKKKDNDIRLMTHADLYKTIDLIYQSRSNNIKIEFQGGEPLLAKELIKHGILYSELKNKKNRKNVEYVICTNLLLMDKDFLDFIKPYPVWISTSLDGPEHLHNLNRPGYGKEKESYKTFIGKLGLTRDVLGTERVSALLTITRDSLNYPIDIINEYIENGFTSIFLRSLNNFGMAVENINQLSYTVEEYFEFYKICLDYIIELNLKGIFFVEELTLIILRKVLTPFFPGFVDLQSPSGLGISCALYNYNGKVYASDEGRMLGEMGDDFFKLGTIDDQYEDIFFSNKSKDIFKSTYLEFNEECSKCVYVSYCGATPVATYLERKSLKNSYQGGEHCRKFKMLIEYLFEQIENQDFLTVIWSWISRTSYAGLTL